MITVKCEVYFKILDKIYQMNKSKNTSSFAHKLLMDKNLQR